MRRLATTMIHELFSAATAEGLDRGALLSGLDHHFVSSLPIAPNAGAQLLMDLHNLNDATPLISGRDHLLDWLENAKVLTIRKPAQAAFVNAIQTLEQGAVTGRVRQPGDAPSGAEEFRGYWTSRWLYNGERCEDLLHIEGLDAHTQAIRGRRTARTGPYEYSYHVHGYLLGRKLFLIARNCNPAIPLGLALVLMPWTQFNTSLAGIVIRPTGNSPPEPLSTDFLLEEQEFWVMAMARDLGVDPASISPPNLRCRRSPTSGAPTEFWAARVAYQREPVPCRRSRGPAATR